MKYYIFMEKTSWVLLVLFSNHNRIDVVIEKYHQQHQESAPKFSAIFIYVKGVEMIIC